MKLKENAYNITYKTSGLTQKKQFTFLVLFSTAIGFLCFPSNSFSQENVLVDIVPPPLNILHEDEIKKLEAEKKMKDRTKLALELMESRLQKSAKFVGENQYRNSLDELGGFQALVRETLNYLMQFQSQKSSLKNFKKFEITLRDFLPQLELIRRGMPIEYGYHVREMMKFVRDARSKAVEPMFGDTVLPEGSE